MTKWENLIINADDFGMSQAINQGILLAIHNGLINSVSVSVTRPYFDDAQALQHCAKKTALGLHVNLTEGQPLLLNSLDSLVENDLFCAAHHSIANEESHNTEQLKREISEQLARFRLLFNSDPTHMDSHQYFTYLSPKAFKAFSEVASCNKIPIRSPAPFINLERLTLFISSVKSRFGVALFLDPQQHVRALCKIQKEINPKWRTMDCEIDHLGDLNTIRSSFENRQTIESLEVVCHPRLN